jgi:nitrogen fixation NifU-like protein
VNDLKDLYREVILDHNRSPRNFGTLDDPDRVVNGVNPLCGDKLTLYLKLSGDRIEDVRFQGTGCAISVASSSLMTERVKGADIDDTLKLFDDVHDMLTGDREPDEHMEKLAARAWPGMRSNLPLPAPLERSARNKSCTELRTNRLR